MLANLYHVYYTTTDYKRVWASSRDDVREAFAEMHPELTLVAIFLQKDSQVVFRLIPGTSQS